MRSKVLAGDRICLASNVGAVASHLHFEVKRADQDVGNLRAMSGSRGACVNSSFAGGWSPATQTFSLPTTSPGCSLNDIRSNTVDPTMLLGSAEVSSISPTDGEPGVPITIVVKGQNLSSTMRVQINNGINSNNTVVSMDRSEIRTTITPTNLAVRSQLSVIDSDGKTVLTVPFDIYTKTLNIQNQTKINDTGISSCFSKAQINSGLDFSDCQATQSIQLSNTQDGMVGRDVTAGQNSNSDGRVGFSYTQLGDQCAVDNVTGLVWETKATSGKSNARDVRNTYTGFLDGREGSVSWYVNQLNANKVCGFSDWRIPTIHELWGIADLGQPIDALGFKSQAPFDGLLFEGGASAYLSIVNSGAIPTNAPQGTGIDWGVAYGDYISSTVWVSPFFSGTLVLGKLQFAEMGTGALSDPNFKFSVRGVRSGTLQSVAQYQLSGDEAVDPVTGLVWKRCVVGMTWDGLKCLGSATLLTLEEAFLAAQSVAASDGKSWRIPNIKELVSIADYTNAAPVRVNASAFPQSPANVVWSSSPARLWAGANLAYAFATDNNAVVGDYRTDRNVVRLVRTR